MSSQKTDRAASAEQADAAGKPPLGQRLIGFANRHTLLAVMGVAVGVGALLTLTLWFTVFSGLSSSADLIYSQF